MNEERISKRELMNIYNISRYTVLEWEKHKNLPLISISSHSKYIRKKDLVEWEDKMIKNTNESK
jgi:hypothetical protein